MCSSNCWFLTYIQVSQETSKVVWYSHLLKNFPRFAVIHMVKGFSIVNKAEVDVFSGIPLFFLWKKQWILAIWSLVPLTFLNPACSSAGSQFMHYWGLAWRILSITLRASEMSTLCVSLNTLWHYPSLGFNTRDLGSILGSERSPEEGNGSPLQYSCLENPMDRGDWWTTVHRVAKGSTWLSDFYFL